MRAKFREVMTAIWRGRETERAHENHIFVEGATRLGKQAVELVRDDELEAVLQFLDGEIDWYKERWARTQENTDERIAEALRAVTMWLANTAHRDVAPADTSPQPGASERRAGDRVPWLIFDPRAPSARFSPHFEVPVIRLDVSHSIPGRRHKTYFINEVMARIEGDAGRALIWRPVDDSNSLFTQVHIEIFGVDRDGLAINIDHEGLLRLWHKSACELMRELARAACQPEHPVTE